MSLSPSPWRRTKGGIVVEDASGDTVALITTKFADNGDLIAKAPAMLSVLHRLKEWQESPIRFSDVCSWEEEAYPIWNDLLAIVEELS